MRPNRACWSGRLTTMLSTAKLADRALFRVIIVTSPSTRSGRCRRVVFPRKRGTTVDRTKSGRPASRVIRAASASCKRSHRGPSDAVPLSSTAHPTRSGNVAEIVPPIMAPHELPTRCAHGSPSASRTSTYARALASKVKGLCSGSLRPCPGGSTAMVVYRAEKCATCAAYSVWSVRRLGIRRIGSPEPLTWTCRAPRPVAMSCVAMPPIVSSSDGCPRPATTTKGAGPCGPTPFVCLVRRTAVSRDGRRPAKRPCPDGRRRSRRLGSAHPCWRCGACPSRRWHARCRG